MGNCCSTNETETNAKGPDGIQTKIQTVLALEPVAEEPVEAAAEAEAKAAQEAAANVICIDSDSDVSESDSHRHPSRRQDSGLRLQGPGASTRTGRTGAPVAGSRKVAKRKGGSEDADATAGGAAGGSAVRGTSATTPPSRAKRRSAVLDRDLVAHRHAVREPLPADGQRKKTLHSYFSAI